MFVAVSSALSTFGFDAEGVALEPQPAIEKAKNKEKIAKNSFFT
ncbi:hypothetical protein skT53_14330 [Effusibacillus dendaii]|uniref:Uncharacterized protein n=1 Tax=Effusibacillus dendaii TaxID=2743772 RepID=A0A7I8D8I1_9BACL|nr:hypothetical protein skT53_14330 [Effusibacillus dendaii]